MSKDKLKPCLRCGANKWNPWVFSGHENMYMCGKCYTMVPWEKINSSPTEDALRAEIEELKEVKECLEEQVSIALDEMEAKDAKIARLRENQIPGRCEEGCNWFEKSEYGGLRMIACSRGSGDWKIVPKGHYCSAFTPRKEAEHETD